MPSPDTITVILTDSAGVQHLVTIPACMIDYFLAAKKKGLLTGLALRKESQGLPQVTLILKKLLPQRPQRKKEVRNQK